VNTHAPLPVAADQTPAASERDRLRGQPLPLSLWLASAAVLVAQLALTNSLSSGQAFWILTLLLIGYNVIEIARVRQRDLRGWVINPAVVASALVFGLNFGVGNLLYSLPEPLRTQAGIADVTAAMIRTMWLALVGAIGMWLGYWSPLASKAGNRATRLGNRWFRVCRSPRAVAIPILISTAIASRLAQISLGVFGYSGTYERFVEMATVTQYLGMGSALGALALLISSLEYHSGRPRPATRVWVTLILALEVTAGLLSGFKSAVVLPFVIVAVSAYVASGRIPRAWIALALVAITVAYSRVEPFVN